ncbi:glutathione S-transferase [Thaumasiovibrio sp. DFM-14]|uniref:glutathione S-transferase n=1 Tax=Thaumasiovibrio sp. DFM-14 TaxID=3384792 RepID=UPI0039A1D056
MTTTPILYSLQNCPYAMRARIAIFKAKQQVLIRAITLSNKPKEMLLVSPKGSVPVLVLQENGSSNTVKVIEESLEVMLWALSLNDPDNLLCADDDEALSAMMTFIARFEHEFIPALNAYGCAKRYHDENEDECRHACEVYLASLESRLIQYPFLFSSHESLVDIAVLPFLRKFARIDKAWFRQSPYPRLREWLNGYLQSQMFSKVMAKHELWLDNRENINFGYV